ncbi:MAG: peroxidase family protein [Pseudomonadota bacterium]
MPLGDPVPDSVFNALAKALGTGIPLSGNIEAGYTYIGQLIAHDIVSGDSGRVVSPFLSLNSIYGAPNCQARYFSGDRFFIGNPWHAADLPRDQNGVAIIPDKRNDENVIISQLQLLWMRFHNFLLDEGYAQTLREAREKVCLLFQVVVIEDFLKQLLHEQVHTHFFVTGGAGPGLTGERLPPEFTHAAFRFGHSMARQGYQLQDRSDPLRERPLLQLFRAQRPITKDEVVDWSFFFGDGVISRAQEAQKIDTFVVASMRRIHRPGQDEDIDIIRTNLMVGREAGVPTGYEMMSRLTDAGVDLQSLGIEKLTGYAKRSGLASSGVDLSHLPLWPYVLEEAMQENEGRNSGLGGLGSLICADVLRTSIKYAPISVFQNGIYDFDAVIARLGDLGRDLVDLGSANGSAPTRRIQMSQILKLFNEKGE